MNVAGLFEYLFLLKEKLDGETEDFHPLIHSQRAAMARAWPGQRQNPGVCSESLLWVRSPRMWAIFFFLSPVTRNYSRSGASRS